SSVDVVAPNDAWAVGIWRRPHEPPGPWIVRLDASGWRTMEYPGDGGESDDVAALSDRDVWMVGERILYFDGRGWVVSEPPAPAARSSSDGTALRGGSPSTVGDQRIYMESRQRLRTMPGQSAETCRCTGTAARGRRSRPRRRARSYSTYPPRPATSGRWESAHPEEMAVRSQSATADEAVPGHVRA